MSIMILDREKAGEENVTNAHALENYLRMPDEEISERIEKARKNWVRAW